MVSLQLTDWLTPMRWGIWTCCWHNTQTSKPATRQLNGMIYRLSLFVDYKEPQYNSPIAARFSFVLVGLVRVSVSFLLSFTTTRERVITRTNVGSVGQKCEERPNTGFIPFHNRETVSHEHSPLPASKQATSSKLHQDDKQPTLQQSNTIYLWNETILLYMLYVHTYCTIPPHFNNCDRQTAS